VTESRPPFCGVPPRACVVNSLPKSGTTLLKKVVGLLPGMTPTKRHLSSGFAATEAPPRRSLNHDMANRGAIALGIGRIRIVPWEVVGAWLERLPNHAVFSAHVPYSPELLALLAEKGIRMVSIIRDPRDVVVSHAMYMPRVEHGRLSDYYRMLSEDERIMTSLVGIWDERRGLFLRDIRQRLQSMLLWRAVDLNYQTRFEWLVGPPGGGEAHRQLGEILAISRHLGLRCSDKEVQRIADHAFGGTTTFRRGQIGSWREHLTNEHKTVCRQLVGSLLVELGYESDLNW